MHLNILLFDNFVISLITYDILSMELKFMLSPKVLMLQYIMIADYKKT